eukprot:CAMPEP_0117650430 /NCGR_PEP_ID=MMETSP0804-20121206/1534_1 /TAXON_ID=1074897 /ORGANISM="Tetraselmis astigmatica, Strain CCMP880" /LENGTH=324 /DNA_ID=CAMNT_0005456299 /DNA_START=351 /DNA_END=1322 /DNA_ORIENTATION=+
MITRLSPALVTAQSPAPTLRGLREPRQLLRNGLGGQQLLIQCAHAPESAAIRPGSRPEGAAGQETDQPELTALSQARRLYVSTSNLLDEACDLPSIVGGPLNWLQDNEGLRDSCEAGKQLRVAVLLSGGVDSSLALQLLHAAGHQVKAFYLQIWFQEDFRNFWDACPWEEDLHYAQEVCDTLGVELEVVPLTTAYWDRVVSYLVGAVRRGLTPNPDVLCNSRVKFGAFFEHLEASYAGQFDRIASGHYASLLRPQDTGEALLAMTADEVKDQTYFLAQLSQHQVARAIFPLGPLTKLQVRQMASAAGLATQSRKDSQGMLSGKT